MNVKAAIKRSAVYNKVLNKGWTKNSINRLLVKFRTTVNRRLDSVERNAHTDDNVDTVESLLLSQEDKPQSHRTVREISREAGDPSVISFADYSQRSASSLKLLQEKALSRVADLPGRRSLRSTNSNRMVVPSARLSTVANRAFPVVGPQIWNDLPAEVTSAESLTTFRHRLKTRCLTDLPKPVSPKPDSAKLGFRVRVGVSANRVSANRH